MKPKIEQIFTLSKYGNGRHVFDDSSNGEPSFVESLSPIHFMIKDLYEKGIPLGSKIKVTMELTVPTRVTGKKK